MQICVQIIQLEPNVYLWLVLGEDGLPIAPIESFMGYLFNTEKSPHTLICYAHHLKLYWQFLLSMGKDWQQVTLTDFSQFVVWLRNKIPSLRASSSQFMRDENTVNTILSALASFYRYHNQVGNTNIQLTEPCYLPVNRHKSLLYHIYKGKPIYKRIISLKAKKILPKTITSIQMQTILNACSNSRDRFLLCLLYESGLRIGQALSLHHEDIKSFDNEIHIICRQDHPNQLRNKSRQTNILSISQLLMQRYTVYINDYSHLLDSSTYVFVNLITGEPLTYIAVRKIFARLSAQVDFWLTPHMLRHTHATELIKSGWDAAFVQKRLGHAHVETTIDQYVHLDHADLKKAFQHYLKQQTKGVGK